MTATPSSFRKLQCAFRNLGSTAWGRKAQFFESWTCRFGATVLEISKAGCLIIDVLAAAICCYLACAMHNIKNIRTKAPHFSHLFHIISCCYLLLPFFAAICCYVLPSAAVGQNQRKPTKSQPQPHLPQPAKTNRNQLKPAKTYPN